MRALASYIMRGPWQAVLVTSAMAMVAMLPFLGFLGVFSGAAVALVGLRAGLKPGLLVVLGAGLVMGLFSLFVAGGVELGLAFVLMFWAPLLGLALILRQTMSWSMTLDATALFGVLVVALVYLVAGNPAVFWERLLTAMIEVLEGQQAGQDFSMVRDQIPIFAQWVTALVGGALVVALIACMMLARWWQSLLYNPGGFATEFRALRQSKATSLAVLVVLALSIADFGMISAISSDVMVIVVVVYSVFGLGLVHALVAKTGIAAGWLVGVYVLAFIALPYVMKVLAALGFADSWVDFRSRLGRPGAGTDKPHDD